MPSSQNWLRFLFVNVAFAIYIASVFYYSRVAEIRANWPLYRCNPMYMFLAENVEENFVYCVQSTQSNFMGYLLQPLTFATGSLANVMGGFLGDIQNIRAMFDKVRTFFSNIIQTVFGIFLNLVIEFQRITISIRDLIGKTIGIMTTLLYMMDGSMKTMQSTWNGPPGQLVRRLGSIRLGKCFHPDTRVRMQDGRIVQMRDIVLGDVLEDGSVVEAVMEINNRPTAKTSPEVFYVIPQRGINDSDIFVTGSHLVYDKITQRFIPVRLYSKARATTRVHSYFSCLITDTHRIKVGNEIFWDWEDHFMKASQAYI